MRAKGIETRETPWGNLMDKKTRGNLEKISVATVTMQLLKRGIRNVSMAGVRPLNDPVQRILGPAYTLRYLPLREDLSAPEVENLTIRENTFINSRNDAIRIHVCTTGFSPPCDGVSGLALCAQIEMEIAALDGEDRNAFLADLGLQGSARDRFIRAAYALLELISFFTTGSDEVPKHEPSPQ